MSDAIAKKFKYSDISHSIEIFGVCSACAVLQSSSIKSRRKPKLS
jgi:Fe2+ or Zn2+ uptake regulation protein